MNTQIETFDLPEDAKYAGHPIIEIGFNSDLEQIFVRYQVHSGGHDWNQVIFSATEENGTVSLDSDNNPVGVVPPEEAREYDTPGANASESLYELLQEIGVNINADDY